MLLKLDDAKVSTFIFQNLALWQEISSGVIFLQFGKNKQCENLKLQTTNVGSTQYR
ncbi:MAG: hypothetical protein ACRCVT_03505 [Leadbetterella sp.]